MELEKQRAWAERRVSLDHFRTATGQEVDVVLVDAAVFVDLLRLGPYYGFLSMAHEMRTDWAMLLGSLFLILAGGGPYSLNAVLTRRRGKAPAPATRAEPY